MTSTTDKIPRGQTPEMQAYQKAWRAANPRDRREWKAAYDAEHREQNAAYRAANAEKIKANKAAHYQANREKILAQVKARSDSNKEAISDYHAEHYLKNAEKIKAYVSKWRSENPEKKAHAENHRRARKANNGGSHTLDELIEKFSRLGNVCYYCGKAGKLSVDHDVPLVRGGTDDIDNILPACRSCNSKKSALTADEYLLKRGR